MEDRFLYGAAQFLTGINLMMTKRLVAAWSNLKHYKLVCMQSLLGELRMLASGLLELCAVLRMLLLLVYCTVVCV